MKGQLTFQNHTLPLKSKSCQNMIERQVEQVLEAHDNFRFITLNSSHVTKPVCFSILHWCGYQKCKYKHLRFFGWILFAFLRCFERTVKKVTHKWNISAPSDSWMIQNRFNYFSRFVQHNYSSMQNKLQIKLSKWKIICIPSNSVEMNMLELRLFFAYVYTCTSMRLFKIEKRCTCTYFLYM